MRDRSYDTIRATIWIGSYPSLIRIKKHNQSWRVVSFPKSHTITSFTVINKSGSESIVPYFINTPYTKKTGYPNINTVNHVYSHAF